MLRFLFPRLTAEPERGGDCSPAVTARGARDRTGIVEGAVADTIDGRFAMLATIAALVMRAARASRR